MWWQVRPTSPNWAFSPSFAGTSLLTAVLGGCRYRCTDGLYRLRHRKPKSNTCTIGRYEVLEIARPRHTERCGAGVCRLSELHRHAACGDCACLLAHDCPCLVDTD